MAKRWRVGNEGMLPDLDTSGAASVGGTAGEGAGDIGGARIGFSQEIRKRLTAAEEDTSVALDSIGNHLQHESGVAQQDWVVLLRADCAQERLDLITKALSLTGNFGHTTGVPYVQVTGTEAELHEMVAAIADDVEMYEPDLSMQAPLLYKDVISSSPPLGSAGFAQSWGLQRIGAFERTHTGKGVHVYVLDSGIRASHVMFGGRAIAEVEAVGKWRRCADSVDTACAQDFNGHGTHAAGIVAAAGYGVAPGATVHAVKVAHESEQVSSTNLLSALDYVINYAIRPAVTSISLSGRFASSSVTSSINRLTSTGVSVVVAAGNSKPPISACECIPAMIASAITVAAVDKMDALASYSNFGSCVDLLAPGNDILSLSIDSDIRITARSGTSFATPHVAGAAALLLEDDRYLLPQAVRHRLINGAEVNTLRGDLRSSPNRLLFVGAAPMQGEPECLDTPDFRDPKGWKCWTWIFTWGRCQSTGWFIQYTEAELVWVRSHCRQTCRMC